MIVAIDGPAGSGKSTIAKEIARQLGFNKLDTGAMYRAVTFAALDRGIDLDNEAAIDALAEQIEIRFTNGTGEDTRLTIDGQDASAAIRTPQVDANVSKVSAYPGVRAAMLIHQRRAAEDRDIVAEGRDIGTVVFPNAQVKVFLTADPRERARRRVLQRHQNDAQPLTTEQLEAEVDETLRRPQAARQARQQPRGRAARARRGRGARRLHRPHHRRGRPHYRGPHQPKEVAHAPV